MRYVVVSAVYVIFLRGAAEDREVPPQAHDPKRNPGHSHGT
jgi:hypothetical protein